MTKAFLLILLLPLTVFGQVAITGKVLNREDGKPVPNASVFLSNATIGDKTAANGTFKLKGVKSGQYNLVVSLVGFETTKQTIIVGGNDVVLHDISFAPQTIALEGVTIKTQKFDRQREINYAKFKKEFLGSGEFAGDCQILNPEALDLKYSADNTRITASSADFLVIENKALGYKIKYLLAEFELDNSVFGVKRLRYYGYALFEELKGAPQQEKDWEKRRSAAYEDSQMHFFRSAISDRIAEEGFRVIRVPAKSDYSPDTALYIDKNSSKGITDRSLLVSGPDRSGLYSLFSKKDKLYISYNRYRHFNNATYTTLAGPGNNLISFNAPAVLFDGNGIVASPLAFTYDGSWARKGIADLLPVDYVDPEAAKLGAETAKTDKIARSLKAWSDSAKIEKVHLHLDKPFYAAGDTIYFKAYVTQGGQHMLLDRSEILHTELIGPDGKIKRPVLLQVDNGIAWGDITLADTLKSGIYRIRAYTNWMRNSNGSSFFEQDIPVGAMGAKRVPEGGQPYHRAANAGAVSNRVDVQFMPEGGKLIANNYSKIAFKAVGPGGSGADIKGTVTDETGEEICTFSSTHLGMGAFNVVAHDGHTYKANITYADGSKGTLDLPKAANTGYTFNLSNSADTIRLRISAGSGSSMDKLSLVAQNGGVIYYAAQSTPGAKFFSAIIPKSRFPAGIAQFTLFSPEGEPLNERLVFINNEADQLKLKVALKDTSKTRQKVTLNLNALAADGQPVTGSFSVAVTDENNVHVDENAENTIMSNLLLTSDLRGTVEQPNYYFTSVNEKTRADLDLLMLTQGYRSFEWKAVMGTAPAINYQPEKALTISGTVKRSGKPAPGAKVKLFTTAGGGLSLDTLTNKDGKFVFRDIDFPEGTKFVVQSKVDKGQDDVTLDLDTLLAPMVSAGNIKVVESIELKKMDTAAYMLNQRRFYQEQQKYGINKTAIILKEVKVNDKKTVPILHSQNLNGSGNADQVLTQADMDKMICGNIIDCLVGVLHDVRFDRLKNKIFSTRLATDTVGMAIFIDGNSAEYGDIMFMNPDDIEGIEVANSMHYAAIYGHRAAYGAIIITTRRSRRTDNMYYRYAPGVVTYKPPGYHKVREFYYPKYDDPKTNQKMADLRSTIFWKPDITPDKDGNASFSYFNSDGKGSYRVVIEGIDTDGNLGRRVLHYIVN